MGIIVLSRNVGGDFVASSIPLKLIYPMASSATPGSGLNSNNRAYKQYPGLEYRLRAGIIGGKYPYTVSVSGIAGMTTERVLLSNGNYDWDIVWSNPTTGSHEYTVTVTDSDGTQVNRIIPLTVGTSGHLFVDSSAGSSGSGTLASPYQQLDDLWADTSAANSIVWFRGGGPSYVTDNITRDPGTAGTSDERIEFADVDGQAIIWIAYPGDTRPVIDYGYTGSGTAPRIRFTGSKIHVEGFRFTNGYVMGLQLDRRHPSGGSNTKYGAYICRNVFDELNVFAASSNQAHVMTMGGAGSPATFGMMIVHNEFSLIGNESIANGVKTYYETQALISGNHFHDIDGPVELKENVVDFTMRDNKFNGAMNLSIGGDLADNEGNNATRGDICYNLIHCESVGAGQGAMRLANGRTGGDGPGPIDVYRNTIIGRILINVLESTQGPHSIVRNVILNDEDEQLPFPYITESGTFDSSRLSMGSPDENLKADFNDTRVSESTGELSGAWASSNYYRGHRAPA